MSKNNREVKIIAAVACPTCQAAVGAPCRHWRQGQRLVVCAARRHAWQVWNASRPADYTHQLLTGVAHASLLCPQSIEARDRLTLEGPLIDGVLRLENEPAARRVIDRLIFEGWKVGAV